MITEGKIITHQTGYLYLVFTCLAAFLPTSGDQAIVFLQPYSYTSYSIVSSTNMPLVITLDIFRPVRNHKHVMTLAHRNWSGSHGNWIHDLHAFPFSYAHTHMYAHKCTCACTHTYTHMHTVHTQTHTNKHTHSDTHTESSPVFNTLLTVSVAHDNIRSEYKLLSLGLL